MAAPPSPAHETDKCAATKLFSPIRASTPLPMTASPAEKDSRLTGRKRSSEHLNLLVSLASNRESSLHASLSEHEHKLGLSPSTTMAPCTEFTMLPPAQLAGELQVGGLPRSL